MSEGTDLPISSCVVEAMENEKQKGKKPVLFLGAAASLFEPTSVVSWWGLVKLVLSSLERKCPAAQALKLTDKLMNVTSSAPGGIPLVVMVDAVSKRIGSEYLEMIRSLSGHQPNPFHRWVADCLIDGSVPAMVTTNFDECVEESVRLKGYKVVNLTGDPLIDRKALDEQLALNQKMNVVVVSNPAAFDFVGKSTGWVGMPGYSFILKIHGDAGDPKSCIDTVTQRIQGLPSPIGHLLSALLQRHPFFFIGFGGGDLESGINYLRFESEKDLASVYWLVREQDQVTEVMNTLNTRLTKGLHILRGSILGKIVGGNQKLVDMMHAWGERIGSFWASVTFIDLAKLAGFKEDAAKIASSLFKLPVNSPLPDDLKLATLSNQAILNSTNITDVCRDQVNVSIQIVAALQNIKSDLHLQAYKKTKESIMLLRKTFPDHRTLPDSWIPYATMFLIFKACGLREESFIYLKDAKEVALISGSAEGIHFLNKAQEHYKDYYARYLVRSKDIENEINKSNYISFNIKHSLKSDNQEVKQDKELLVALPALDNTADLFAGIPENLFIRAHLHRAMLIADKVVIAPNFLLNSRVFVTEVLFEDELLCEEYLHFIKPQMPRKQKVNKDGAQVEINFELDPTPFVTYREECQVKNPGFFHEEIDVEKIKKIDAFYKKHPELVLWYDFSQVANSYGKRTKEILAQEDSYKHFPDEIQDHAKKVAPPLQSFVEMCLLNGYLTRTQMYQYGNLFRHPTNEETFKKTFAGLFEKIDQDRKEMICVSRSEVASRPWYYTSILKEFSDAAYVSNLPLTFGFSLILDEDTERAYRILEPVLQKEFNRDLIKSVDSVGNIRSTELARLTVSEIIQLRTSITSVKFRQSLLDMRYDDIQREATSYYEFLNQSIITPENRDVLEPRFLKKVEDIPESFLSELLLTVTKSPPVSPMYRIPYLRFPGFIGYQPEKKEEERKRPMASDEHGVIEKIEERVAYSVPENPWVKLYFDKVKFPNGKEGFYNRIVEKGGVPGVVIFAVNEKKEVAMIKNYRYPVNGWQWEIPRGFGELELSPQENAIREMKEEIGYEGKVEFMGSLLTNSGMSSSEADYFLATDLKKLSSEEHENIKEDVESISQIVFVSIDSLRKMIKQGVVRDAFTISALSLYTIHSSD